MNTANKGGIYMVKAKSRARIELAETEGMSLKQMEAYMLERDYITPELAARYLGGFSSAQGVRVQIRNGTLPIAQYHNDATIRISPERTIKFKHGTLGTDSEAITAAVEEAFASLTEKLTAAAAQTIKEELGNYDIKRPQRGASLSTD